ncbi:hypothetical protein [Halomonas sp. I5-271120]|uniref:hypothetical protein n=1 Tax=Halomonas sp. I5-271120 TaxID=3061632 RepID=UPI002714F989|nr:hypothetical protein [Halomonas sp. I5-271120]
MNSLSTMPDKIALDHVRTMVVEHYINNEDDPRHSTCEDMIAELSAALHFDALDDGIDIDAELGSAFHLLQQTHSEYCQVKAALEGKGENDTTLLKLYSEIEARVYRDLTSPSFVAH